MATFETIDSYIASFPPDVQVKLEAVRQAIRQAAPGTEETISYGIPAFKLGGRGVVSFAGWKNHISVYPMPPADDTLTAELAQYRAAKSTLRFPLDHQMPLSLIGKVAAALLSRRVEEAR